MDISADGRRDSRFAVCVDAAASYGDWQDVADKACLTVDERQYLWGRQILNKYAFEGYH